MRFGQQISYSLLSFLTILGDLFLDYIRWEEGNEGEEGGKETLLEQGSTIDGNEVNCLATVLSPHLPLDISLWCSILSSFL